MLSIVGLGVAEVKYQAHGGDVAFAAEQSTVAEENAVSIEDTATVESVPVIRTDSANTAGAGISRAVAKVSAAYSGRWDKDEDDEYEDRNEDEDEGDDNSRGATTATVTKQPAATKSTSAAPVTTAVPASAGTFTLAQIATHNSAASCYSAISGNVYDLSSFVSQHPGGASAIKSLCGVDGTAAYNGQHGGSGRPASELASLKIGVLAN